MRANRHDRTAIGAIILGTLGAVALAGFFLARTQGPQVHVIQIESAPEAELSVVRLRPTAPKAPEAPVAPVPPEPAAAPEPPTPPLPPHEPEVAPRWSPDGKLLVYVQTDGKIIEKPEGDVSAEPTFTPYEVAPRLLNRDQVGPALTEAYPPLLRDAGIGGRATVYFFINVDGEVEQVQINDSSGHSALDQAALQVAAMMTFEPARLKGQATPVWISLPISFEVR